MAITKTQVSQLYVSIFGRSSEGEGNAFWQTSDTTTTAADSMFEQQVVLDYFGVTDFASEANVTLVVETIYLNALGKTPAEDSAGIQFWVDSVIVDGDSIGTMAAALTFAATTIANAGAAQDTFNNKVAVSNRVADSIATFTDFDQFQAYIADVDETSASVDAANAAVDADADSGEEVDPGEVGETFKLTTGADDLVGTTGDDTFTAHIFDNQNTAQSGDIIDGGTGTDSLFADIGDSQAFAITLDTNSVENFAVRAQAVDGNDNSDNNMSSVQIDAERMVGTNRYESNNSRADVVIEDVRIEDAQITKDITIAMVQTDPGDVDFGVYFDQHSLRAASTSQAGAVLNLEIMDTRSADAGLDPLLENPFNGFTFTLGGVEFRLASPEFDSATTYSQLLAAIQAQILATVGIEDTVTASISGTFTAIDTDSGNSLTGQTITLTNSGSGTFEAGSWTTADGTLPAGGGLHRDQDTLPPSSSTNLITSEIILDDVGRGSMGGDLVVGGLSIGNNSNGGTSNSKGVEQFNIKVERSSKLQTINSTQNTLEEVFIVNGETKGNLTVTGDVNNGVANDLVGDDDQDNAFGFSDVRILDASALEGSITATAELTGAVVAKYMNRTDTGLNPTDNIDFVYSLGSANDSLALTIDNANLLAAGTTAREDFTLTINGAAGNDWITTIIGDGTGNDGTAWYDNSVINANLTVNGDAGNDTITTTGAGNFTINASSGDDTVYADNSGLKGSYAINATAASTTLETANAVAVVATDVLLAAEAVTNTVEVAANAAAAIVAAKVITAASTHTVAAIAAMDLALDNAATAGATPASIYATLLAATAAAESNGALLVSDADTITGTVNAFLTGATLTVTYAGAAANSVIAGLAAVGAQGYESSVVLNTAGNFGNELTIVQAIKDAINNDAVLSKLLTAQDGTGNTLSITNDIDGLSAVTDLEFTLVAANAAGTSDGLASAATNISGATKILSASELTSVKADWNDLLNTSGAAITDAAVYTQLGLSAAAALAAVTQAVIKVGNESTATSDNVISMGSGDDVIVLGTNDALLESNDTLVWAGYNQGNDTIVNYLEGAGTNLDTIDFSAYLSDGALNKISLTGSTASQTQIAQVKTTAVVTAADAIVANEIVIQTGLTFTGVQQTAGQSFDNMTAANFAAAINNAATTAYGNINAAIDADNTIVANFVGATQTSIVMVENNLNLGEYKIFELTQDNTANLEFSGVQLIGTVDFGDSITLASVII